MQRFTLQFAPSVAICGLLAAASFFNTTSVLAADLYAENFEGLTLGPVVTFDSEIRERQAWTDVPPTGWTVDDSGVPTAGDPNIGVKEFEGWSFVNKDWWIATAGDQDRGLFSNASGIIAVADPDEWDDFPSFAPSPSDLGSYVAKLTTSSISLSGVAAEQAKVFFHSSWRYENLQKASLTAHYNNGTDVNILQWDSRKNIDDGLGGTIPNPDFKDDAPNEGLTFDLHNPAGATSVQLEFRLYDAGNNWWWAFDNLKVFTGAAPAADGALRAIIDRETGSVKIVNNTGQAISLRGYSLRSTDGAFDEANATFLSQSDPNWLQATRLGDPANDLSEIHLTSADLANQAVINFGNVWQKYYKDDSDIHFEYLVDGNDTPIQGILEFMGNGDESYDFLDLNYNGAVEIGDWLAFKAGFAASLTDQPDAIRHNLGDLDNDGFHTAADFLEFQQRFNNANGAGSFAAMIAGVPEPSSFVLFFVAAVIGSVGRRRPSARRVSLLALIAVAVSVVFSAGDAHAQLKIFTEDFEELALGPNVEEANAGSEVWTNVPPTGWLTDNSGMPGLGNPLTDGIKEWIGWTFADKDWWVQTASDQDRGMFTRGQGTVMIADPDEWDDENDSLPTPQTGRRALAEATTPNNLYDTFIKTKTINIPAGIPAGRIKLAFDSSWKPEGMDDLDLSNNQTATIKVQYGNGPKTEVLRWDSDPESDTFHDDAPNERISGLDLQYDGTATTMTLEFGLGQAWNDWWWAVDNLSVEVPADPSLIKIDTNTGRGFLVGGDVISTTVNSIDITSENGHLRGATASGLSGASGMERIDGPDVGSVAGDSPGEQWEMLTANNNRIFEAFLFGNSAFDNSRVVDLGIIFDPSTPLADRDVAFSYTTATGDQIAGAVQYFAAPGVPGDYSGNGVVDAADYTLWRNHLDQSVTLPNDTTPGTVTAADYDVWKSHFGQSVGAGGGAAAVASVPEPATVSLVVLAAAVLAMGSRKVHRQVKLGVIALALSSLFLTATAQAFTLDRDYGFGDDDPGAAAGGTVTTIFDNAGSLGMHQLTDLAAVGGLGARPKYVTVSDRPDGVTSLGIQLNSLGIEKQYLKTGFGEALNFPEQSPASTFSPGGTIDYSFISDRGFQLWAKPTALPTAQAFRRRDGFQPTRGLDRFDR